MTLNQLFNVLKRYGIFGLIRLIFGLTYTNFFFSGARLVRRPLYVTGKKYIDFGKGLTTGINLRIDAISKDGEVVLRFGQNVQLNDYVHIGAAESIVIEDNVLIASKVFITDHNHGVYTGSEQSSPLEPPMERKLYSRPVFIGKNVWIGEYVSVLPGVSIGEGSIIGSMSVVSKSIPSFSIAVGSPARVIKRFDFEINQWVKI